MRNAELQPRDKVASIGVSPGERTRLRQTLNDNSTAGREKIGRILSKEGIITADMLNKSLDILKKQEISRDGKRPLKLCTILLKLGYIEKNTIYNVLTRSYKLRGVSLSNFDADRKLIEKFHYDVMSKYLAFPLGISNKILSVAMVDPMNTEDIDKMQHEVKLEIDVRVCSELELVEAYAKHYKIDEAEIEFYNEAIKTKKSGIEDQNVIPVDDFGKIISQASAHYKHTEEEQEEERFNANEGPIIKLVDGIVVKAVLEGVSDIHVEPTDKFLVVRYRIDGSLYKSMNLPGNIKSAVVSRFKILSKLKIEEKRVPHDGRMKMRIGQKTIDFRVSTLPIIWGEKVVLRILDSSNLQIDLTKLGLSARQLKMFKRSIERPFGLILVTGPTGSGKTVTLYSSLKHLNNENMNIMTAEKPVEFHIRGLNQVNIDETVGMTFPKALKAFLRQDPNVIMIGEMRDLEEALIGIEAAQTGHLVFSTLHTNDAPSAITRLVDMGIPPYSLSSSLTMVVAQRLVRRLCPYCKKKYKPVTAMLETIGFTKDEAINAQIFKPVGCEKCNGVGYKGRIGLFEVLEMNGELEKSISAGVGKDQIRDIATRFGMTCLRRSGIEKIIEGQTSLNEVTKETVLQKETLPQYLAAPEIEEYNDGEIIIREGNSDKDFFQILRGAIDIYKGNKKIEAITEAGSHFGELEALANQKRVATYRAHGRAIVKRFPGDKLEEIIKEYPDIALAISHKMATRMSSTIQLIGKVLNNNKGL